MWAFLCCSKAWLNVCWFHLIIMGALTLSLADLNTAEDLRSASHLWSRKVCISPSRKKRSSNSGFGSSNQGFAQFSNWSRYASTRCCGLSMFCSVQRWFHGSGLRCRGMHLWNLVTYELQSFAEWLCCCEWLLWRNWATGAVSKDHMWNYQLII